MNRKTLGHLHVMFLSFVVATISLQDFAFPEDPRTDEVIWDEESFEVYLDAAAGPAFASTQNVEVRGEHGVVSGTSGVLASRVGLETLKNGGNAVDAMIAVSLVQVTQTAGSAISFAGIMTMVYYDAESGEVHSLNGGYNTVHDELDPMSIPGLDEAAIAAGKNALVAIREMEPSGRTALVPGFMAGIQAAHDRFGKLPWASLIEPAIYVARKGLPVQGYLAQAFAMNKDTLQRLAETKAVFTNEDGNFYGPGDTFTQKALADTLGKIAAQGAGYMYSGPWAEKFVALVQQEGGKMTMRDMRDYRVIWSPPIQTSYNGYDIYAYALPAQGGVHTIEALNLLESANLRQYGDKHWESAEAMRWYAEIMDLPGLSFLTTDERNTLFPEVDLSLSARTSKAASDWIWDRMRKTDGEFPKVKMEEEPRHSAAVVVIDRWRNMCAVVHSINTVNWGRTGIMVDGISIPDSAWFQQKAIADAGPGKRLPDPTNPCIVLRDGKPHLASSSIGSDLHYQTIQGLYYALEYGMGANDSVNGPAFLGPGLAAQLAGETGISMRESDFGEEVIEGVKELGIHVSTPPQMPRFWLVATVDPQTGVYSTSDAGTIKASGNPEPVGLALGY